jgi:hypothetical protein
MSKPGKKEEMEVNIDLLPEPTKRVEAADVSIYQWGWPGFDLDHDFLSKYEHNVGKLLPVILNSSNGVFFILIKDKIRNRWIFFPDLYACKKIFYMQKGKMIYLTDFLYKFKSLLNTRDEIDTISIGLFLMYGYIPGNDTLYRCVKSLKPFTYVEYKDDKLNEYPYYHFEFAEINMSYREAVQDTVKLLEQRLLCLTRDFKTILVPLSGGRDSRFLLALTLKHFRKEQITTFTFGQKGTMDFEIGKGFAKKFKLDSILMPFHPRDYFERYVKPATPYKNGIVNHACNSPAKFYEEIMDRENQAPILSGFIGDAVLAWCHRKRIATAEDGLMYPETALFSLTEITGECFPGLKQEFYTKLKSLVDILYDRNRNLETERWLYYIHVPYFTNPCMFSEEKMYPFILPFADVPFFEFMKKVPSTHKMKTSYYEDILREDLFIYRFFHYPLKTLLGAGYGTNRIHDLTWKSRLSFRAFRSGAGRLKNYIRFENAYSPNFLKHQCSYLKDFEMLNPLLKNFDRYPFEKKCVLLSLKLNFETFFL